MADADVEQDVDFDALTSNEQKLLDQMESELAIKAEREVQTDPLYHYTSGDALLKILETKELWATHFRYLNDREELQLGEGVIQNEAEKALADYSKDSGEAYLLRNFCQL